MMILCDFVTRKSLYFNHIINIFQIMSLSSWWILQKISRTHQKLAFKTRNLRILKGYNFFIEHFNHIVLISDKYGVH